MVIFNSSSRKLIQCLIKSPYVDGWKKGKRRINFKLNVHLKFSRVAPERIKVELEGKWNGRG